MVDSVIPASRLADADAERILDLAAEALSALRKLEGQAAPRDYRPADAAWRALCKAVYDLRAGADNG